MTDMSMGNDGRGLSWFTLERREWLCVVVAVGLIGFSIGNGHTTQDSIAHISTQLGDQKKIVAKVADIAGCQTVRANIAKREAMKSEVGDDVDIGAIPNCAALAAKK